MKSLFIKMLENIRAITLQFVARYAFNLIPAKQNTLRVTPYPKLDKVFQLLCDYTKRNYIRYVGCN